MVEEDYVIRLINDITRTILKLVFHLDNKKGQQIFDEKESGSQYEYLVAMVNNKNVNEAENYLIENLDDSDIKQLKVALMFYSYLNEKSDDYLEQCNYSRKEIADGLKYVTKMYGYDGLVSSFLDI